MLKRIYHSSRSVSKENPARGRVIYTSVVHHPGQLSNFYPTFISSPRCIQKRVCFARRLRISRKKKKKESKEISNNISSTVIIGKKEIYLEKESRIFYRIS